MIIMKSKLMYQIIFMATIICLPFVLAAQTNSRSGRVVDSDSQGGVSYVSIGVNCKDFGTIADSTGLFTLLLDETVNDLDTIIFSRVGYRTSKKILSELKNVGTVLTMQPVLTLLSEVNISVNKQDIETYGKTPAKIYLTPRAYLAVPRNSDVSGREQATILDIDQNILLKEINFLLILNNYKSVKYRLNFYAVKDNLPDQIIALADIIFETADTKG